MNRSPAVLRHTVSIAPMWLAGWLAIGSAIALAPWPAQAASDVRKLPEFQAVSVQAPVDVVVRQGSPQSVTLSGDDKLLALLEAVVEGGAGSGAGRDAGSGAPTLVLRFKRAQGLATMSLGRSNLKATVVVPRLSALTVAGSGDVTVERFNTPALQVSVAGSGDVVLAALSSDELQVSLAGSGDVRGRGKATKLKVQVAGSGDVRLADLRADAVTVSLAGSGDVAVQAQSTLAVSIVGSGDVTYTGAAKVTRAITGSGTVQQR